ncbi:MAG: uroporphyrinogen decarboxylase [Pseudomonadota bacterium]
MTHRLLATLRGEATEPPPLWLMRQAGRYLPEYREIRQQVEGFIALCMDSDRAAEVTLQPVRRYGLDAAILFSDILIVPHALGQSVRFEEGEGPKLDAIRTSRTVNSLSIDGVAGAVGPIWKTVEKVRAGLAPDAALIGFAGSPWTVATYMVEGGGSKDFSAVKHFALSEPSAFAGLLDRVVEASILYLRGQIDAGAQVIKLFDSWAGAVPSDRFDEWVIAPTGRIVDALKESHTQIPIIGFPRGAGANYHRYVDRLAIDAVAVDPSVPLSEMQTLQKRLPVQGKLDPAFLHTGGPALEQAVKTLLDGLAGGPFVFNLGHGIHRFTPPDNVAALVDIVRSHRPGVR